MFGSWVHCCGALGSDENSACRPLVFEMRNGCRFVPAFQSPLYSFEFHFFYLSPYTKLFQNLNSDRNHPLHLEHAERQWNTLQNNEVGKLLTRPSLNRVRKRIELSTKGMAEDTCRAFLEVNEEAEDDHRYQAWQALV